MINPKLIFRSLAVILIFAAVASCDDEPLGEGYDDDIPNPNASFQVDIDGQTFTATNSGMLTENGVTRIIGSKNDGSKVSMLIAGSGTGSFTLDGTSEGNAQYIIAGEEPFTMENMDTIGVVTISKYDIANSVASGTFSFSASRTVTTDTTTTDSTSTDSTVVGTEEIKAFTNGVFNNISLQTDLAPPEEPGESAFHVELNGELYTGNNIESAITPNEGLVIGTSNDVKQFVLQVFNPAEGSFTLGGLTDDEGLIIYDTDSTDDESAVFTANEGTITISELNEENQKVSGTFTGTMASTDLPDSTITMTEGVFENISYMTGEDVVSDSLVATIGGESFTSSDIVTASSGDGNVAVVGTDELNDELQLTIPENTVPGDYSINAPLEAYSANYRQEDPDTGEVTEYDSFNNSGSIVIEERVGSVISGHFSFSVQNDDGEILQVTEGHFNLDIGL